MSGVQILVPAHFYMNKKRITIVIVLLVIFIVAITALRFPVKKDVYPKERERIYSGDASSTETVMQAIVYAENFRILDGELGSAEVLKSLTNYKDWYPAESSDGKIFMKLPPIIAGFGGLDTPHYNSELDFVNVFPGTYELVSVPVDAQCFPNSPKGIFCVTSPVYAIELIKAENLTDLKEKVAEIFYSRRTEDSDPCAILTGNKLTIGRKLDDNFYVINPIISKACQYPWKFRIKFNPARKIAIVMIPHTGYPQWGTPGDVSENKLYKFSGEQTVPVYLDRLIFESISL